MANPSRGRAVLMNMRRGGRINLGLTAFLLSVAVFTTLVALLSWDPRPRVQATDPIILYCAAGIRAPVDAAVAQYEKEYGVRVQVEYGGSNTLLARLQVSGRGDLYLPADDSYLETAAKKGLIDEVIPLARVRVVAAVPRGNPKKIESIQDLLREDVRLAQANPDAAAVGNLTRDALTQSGDWAAVEKHTTVFKPTVNEVANDVKLGTVDAAFVWDATVRQYPELEAVKLQPLAGAEAHISIAVLRSSSRPAAALRLARYLGAADRGLPEFGQAGFAPVEGDAWSESPQLLLLSGAMLRPAIEQTIAAFEWREGAHVHRVYNGCGILVAQMKAGERPDAYFSCDSSFMAQVSDLFIDERDISSNPMIILVPRGNPRQIASLADLARPGLRLGLAHERQSALGALTRRVLIDGGVYEPARRNLAVESATGDLLVNQLRAGSLDAAIVYLSNAAAAREHVEAIRIPLPSAEARQPIAVGKDSNNKRLASRLVKAILSAESRQRFESLGFGWKASAEQ